MIKAHKTDLFSCAFSLYFCFNHLVDPLADSEDGICTFCAGVEGNGLTEDLLDLTDYLFLGVETFTQLHCSHILERIVKYCESE